MLAGKNVWCDGLVAIHGCRSMKLQQICLRTWYHSIRHVSFENQREKLLDQCPSIRNANLNCETSVDYCYVVNATDMPAGPVRLHCYVAAAATNMYSGLVYLPQTPLLSKHAYWLSDVQDGCLLDLCHSISLLIFNHSISMPADLLPLIHACLLVFCISIYHTFVYVVSLSAVPADVEPHYRPCLLVWCLIISHTFWCVVSP